MKITEREIRMIARQNSSPMTYLVNFHPEKVAGIALVVIIVCVWSLAGVLP